MSCTAQLPAALAVTQFDEANIGISGRVTCFLQARNGFLWFGSSNGLVRYDGYTFKNYLNDTGLSNSITHLVEDQDQNIWMSFFSGTIARFNPQNGQFKNIMLHSPTDVNIGSGDVTTLFFDRANRLWLGIAQKGLLQADTAGMVRATYSVIDFKTSFYAPSLGNVYNTVYAIHEDAASTLWLATHNGLFTFSKANSVPQAVREEPLRLGVMRKDLFRTITADGDSLWMGSWAGGLGCYNTKTGRWHHYLFNAPHVKTLTSTTNLITGVAAKSAAELWIASPDRGFGVFNKTTESFYFFSNNSRYPNISNEEWSSLITDKDGNIWGLQLQTLLRVRPRHDKFRYYPTAVSHTDSRTQYEVSDVWENESVKLIATNLADGLQVLDKRSGKTRHLSVDLNPKEEPFMYVRQLYEDPLGRIFVLTRDFIYQYKNGALVKTPQPPLYTKDSISNNFVQLTVDNTGALWIASRRNGIFTWDTAHNRYLHIAITPNADVQIPADNIRSVQSDGQGRMWIAASDGLLGFMNVQTKKLTALPVGYGHLKKLLSDKAYALLADHRGNIWAGTTNGLYYFNCNGAIPQLQNVFRGTDGLRSDFILNIQEDNAGNIWCLSEAALCMLPQGNQPVSAFGPLDGLLKAGRINIIRTRNDTMLLGSYAGYYTFTPSDFNTPVKTYPLHITSMQVADKPFYFGEPLQQEGKLHLSPAQNFFSFEFAALDFEHPEKEHYAYKLEGFDKDWIYPVSRRFVSYTNVPGGDYVFHVRSSTDRAFAKASELRLPVHVGTPIYKRPLFFAVVSLVVLGILYALYRSRIRHHEEVHQLLSKAQLLEKEKALVQYEGLKQQLNPHFLFNSLTSLNSLITEEPKRAKQFLERMSKIYRYILKSRDHELVPLHDEAAFVDTYIKLQQTRFGTGLEVTITIDKSYRSYKIVPVTLQNLIENAIKHNITDKDTPLRILITSENGYFVVRNNLQKRASVESSNKQGLHQMKTLYQYLTDKPLLVEEDDMYFTVKIPLIE
jgi:ligand-binding sensor domain-containing protein